VKLLFVVLVFDFTFGLVIGLEKNYVLLKVIPPKCYNRFGYSINIIEFIAK